MPSPVPPRSPLAGGVLIASGVLLGAMAGFALGEATPGALFGAAAGVAAALVVWALDRRR